MPVYEVEGDETEKIRKLHRNHLYMVDYHKMEDDEKNGNDDEKDDNDDEEVEIIEEEERMDASRVIEGDVTSESSDDDEGMLLAP
jgi:hypothetical protein